MREYEVIVIGAGSGLDVASACSRKWKTALIEEGPLGGTCLNRGCIPTKILAHIAEVIHTIKNSEKFGITVESVEIDYLKAISNAWVVDEEARKIEEAVTKNPIDLYKGRAEFIDEHTLIVNGKELYGERIVIAAGTRPFIPPIKGIEKIRYLTNREILRLTEFPRELVVLGGGYIGVEFANFFSAVGSRVKVLQRSNLLMVREDEDVARFFTEKFSETHEVHLGFHAEEIEEKSGRIIVHSKEGLHVEGTHLLVATGRIPNSDILKVRKAGVKTNEKGFIECDEYMKTNKEHIWALGDIAGKYLFKHTANAEAACVIKNIFGIPTKMDYRAVPHAVFSEPQISGVGKTERQLKNEGVKYLSSTYQYEKTGMGLALKEEGFVKMLTDYEGNILGCHIVGPHASLLIHEVLVSMRAGSGNVKDLVNTIHIHPALNEVVQRAAASI